MATTREPQYELLLRVAEDQGIARLGLMANQSWQQDPRRLAFLFSRYKFVAKMLAGRDRVLEIGCGDAFASRIVQQSVKSLTCVDFDPVFIEDARNRADPHWPMDLRVHDMMDGPLEDVFDAAFCLDVLEHIQPTDEDRFLTHARRSLHDGSAMIVGIPSLESQAHASPQSRAGHVNCKTADGLRATLERHFANVFIFSMNDEVVHTGFYPMAQYLMALCCTPRRDRAV